jgi:hypothetical protein
VTGSGNARLALRQAQASMLAQSLACPATTRAVLQGVVKGPGLKAYVGQTLLGGTEDDATA